MGHSTDSGDSGSPFPYRDREMLELWHELDDRGQEYILATIVLAISSGLYKKTEPPQPPQIINIQEELARRGRKPAAPMSEDKPT